jgi:peroxiredoxin
LVAISSDSPFAHAVFADQMKIEFALLSDYNREAARAFGVLRDELFGFRVVNTRAAFLVNPDCTVLYAWVTEDPNILPDPNELLRAAEAVVGAAERVGDG